MVPVGGEAPEAGDTEKNSFCGEDEEIVGVLGPKAGTSLPFETETRRKRDAQTGSTQMGEIRNGGWFIVFALVSEREPKRSSSEINQ